MQPYEEATIDNCVSMPVIQDTGKYDSNNANEPCEIHVLKNPWGYNNDSLILSVEKINLRVNLSTFHVIYIYIIVIYSIIRSGCIFVSFVKLKVVSCRLVAVLNYF